MSWDILIFNTDKAFDLEAVDENIIDAFPSKEYVIDKIRSTFPYGNMTDPEWGSVDDKEGSIEFNLGGKEIGNNFMLHVRGGGDPVAAILRMCDEHRWIALDISDGDFLTQHQNSFEDWTEFRDKVVSMKPWWKFW